MSQKNKHQETKYRIRRLIIFSKEEYEMLLTKANLQRKPFGTFVRELALAKVKHEYIVPLDIQNHEVKLLLLRYGVNLNQIAHICNALGKISLAEIQKIQKQFSAMQQGIMKIYNAPIQVKDLVRHTLIKNPEYLGEIKKILNEFQK